GLALPRQQLDAILLEAARAAGVMVVTRVRVDDLIHDAGSVVGVRARADAHAPFEVRAALTVGADGLHSLVRRRLHLQNRGPRLRKVALTAHVSGIAALTNFGEMHLLPGACVGIAPVDAGRQQCNLTLVLDRTRHGRSIAGKSIAAFLDHVNRFPGVRDRLDHARVHGLPLASGPFDQSTRGVVVPGAALVGDAAGYYDPFTGQGIYQAVAGGSLLARHATLALRRSRAQPTLTSYQRALRAAVRETRAVQWLLESICARPALANRCLHALSAAPEAATALVAVTGDLWPPHSLLSPAPLFSFLRHFARSAA
ncbi:MAG TPA: NAD(P)/FAD-dependent oxidoreductase, partial [Longimicrobiales bacterium]|nr:NAD(P)/FAD-dependent oxidoreductase [Longimicrobiales bacterium]